MLASLAGSQLIQTAALASLIDGAMCWSNYDTTGGVLDANLLHPDTD